MAAHFAEVRQCTAQSPPPRLRPGAELVAAQVVDQREQGLRRLASRGNGPIVAVGFNMGSAVEKVATEFPKTQFTIIDRVVDKPNVQSLIFKEHEGSFLVGALAAIASNEQLRQYADSPKVSAQQVLELFVGVAKQPLTDMARNFLQTVIDNGRVAVLPEIASQFHALKNAQAGTADAIVYSAFDIDAAALADVKTALEKRFGRKLNVSVALQPELIGGIRVVVGDEVLDTSVKARLDQMKVALTA